MAYLEHGTSLTVQLVAEYEVILDPSIRSATMEALERLNEVLETIGTSKRISGVIEVAAGNKDGLSIGRLCLYIKE